MVKEQVEMAVLKDPGVQEVMEVKRADLKSGQVIALPSGKVGSANGMGRGFTAKTNGVRGDHAGFQIEGFARPRKKTGLAIVAGQQVFWDRTARAADLSSDLLMGICNQDAQSADDRIDVDLNAAGGNIVDLVQGVFDTQTTGSASASSPAGSAVDLILDSTVEAQRFAFSSAAGVPVRGPVIDGTFVVRDVGAAGVQFNVGITNALGTAWDGTVRASFQMDGTLTVKAEATDGTNTVAPTDTTVAAVVGVPMAFCVDARDLTSVKFYLDGVRVLVGTTFSLAAATGNVLSCASLLKASAATTAKYQLRRFRMTGSDEG